MTYLSENAIVVIEGSEYSSNDVMLLTPSRIRIALFSEVWAKFQFSKLDYLGRARQTGCPDMVEFDLQAQDSNGHVRKLFLKLKNENRRITVEPSCKRP